MSIKSPIHFDRVRRITGSFSWIDHRFITKGFMEKLTTMEILLYFFLVAVGDKNGVSFYHLTTMSKLLKVPTETLRFAIQGLTDKSLIAYRDGVYQVLELPPLPIRPEKEDNKEIKREEGYSYGYRDMGIH